MKKLIIFVLTICIGVSLIGCTKKSNPQTKLEKTTSNTSNLVDAKAKTTKTFIESLNKLGYSYKTSKENDKEFLAGDLTKVVIGEDIIGVYEYPNPELVEKNAKAISSDGSMVGNAVYDWKAAPHFYKNGTILVTYIGGNKKIIDTLEKLMGHQFAGM
ncbi:MAG: hypothetical protein Q8936_10630 [Bacillota bacterium]|nr:hypothetical protein [Bacillota bacterium]